MFRAQKEEQIFLLSSQLLEVLSVPLCTLCVYSIEKNHRGGCEKDHRPSGFEVSSKSRPLQNVNAVTGF